MNNNMKIRRTPTKVYKNIKNSAFNFRNLLSVLSIAVLTLLSLLRRDSGCALLVPRRAHVSALLSFQVPFKAKLRAS